MRNAIYRQSADSKGEPSPSHSSLTINHPNAGIGLMNLLELAEHRIESQGSSTVHWLRFNSGETLRIVADERCVTVDGDRIGFHPSEVYPFNTLLCDPEQKYRRY